MRRRRWLALIGLVALATLPGGAAFSAEEDEPDYATTQGQTEPIYDESVSEEYRVETPHGTIYGVVERPVVPEGVKVPVILTYSPYWVLERPVAAMTDLGGLADYYVPRGYARAEFDLVGTRESSGCYDHGGIREQETGAAVVDFLGSQEWSNGKVGMIGGSYDGTTQWAAAIKQPKHLTTIVPQVAIGRWYDYAYGQGVRFYSGSGTPTLFDFGFGFLPPTGVTGGTAWAEALQDHVTPCERVEHNERAFLPDPVYDEFWDERDYLAQIDKVQASVLVVGSWTDYNVHPVNSFEMWRALPAAHPKKLVMGMSGHSGAQVEDNDDIYHAWFDHWLYGLDTGVMALPQSDSLVNDAERYQDSAWPPVGTVDVPLTLDVGDGAKGKLGLDALEAAVWTDNNPTLMDADAVNGNGGDAAVLFLGAPVEAPVRIAGVPVLEADITTSAASTFLTPVLFVEDDAGSRTVITKGLLNSRNRNGLRGSEPLTPGETWHARVEFQPIDRLLTEGSRLGLAVMSMNFLEALYPDDTTADNELVLDGLGKLVVPTAFGGDQLGTVVTKPVPKPPVVPPKPAGPLPPAPRPKPTLPATGLPAALPAAAVVLTAAAAVPLRRRVRG